MSDDTLNPIEMLSNCFGQTVSIYGLTYDKQGTCTSPKTRDHLADFIDAEGFTDVIFYSHGWNNEYPVAKERYEIFLRGISDTNSAHSAGISGSFKPLFIGVFWPSTILVWPSDRTPDIAAEVGADSLVTEFDTKELADTLGMLPSDAAGLLKSRLNSGDRLSDAEGRQLAAAFAEVMSADDDELAKDEGEGALGADDILAAWQRITGTNERPKTEGSAEDFGADDGDQPSDAEVAGLLGFDPRVIIRATTMWKMKDRAGVVGINGVSDTLGLLVNSSRARFHLVGHSYGCKVVTTALVNAEIERKVHSLTLLQPAINHLAFAPEAQTGRPGAFRAAFDRLEKPIFSTFSWQDVPLYQLFHLAARRKKDVGELQFAAKSVNRYYGLGGYGPQVFKAGEVIGLKLPRAGEPYPEPAPSVRLIGLDGAVGITGHSDVNTEYTFWAMLQQLA